MPYESEDEESEMTPMAATKRAGFVGMRGKKADESLELEAGPHEDQFGDLEPEEERMICF